MNAHLQDRREFVKLLSGLVAGLSVSPPRSWTQEVPWSSGTEKPRVRVPPNATDCHHHIYDSRYPVDPSATLRPKDATVADYRRLQQRLELARHVIVQPSTYGTDNSGLMDALAAFGATA